MASAMGSSGDTRAFFLNGRISAKELSCSQDFLSVRGLSPTDTVLAYLGYLVRAGLVPDGHRFGVLGGGHGADRLPSARVAGGGKAMLFSREAIS
jgi:hypothetical protein